MGAALEAALEYATMYGWPIVPLHTPREGKPCDCNRPLEPTTMPDGTVFEPCKSPGKHPRLMHGLKDASTAPDTIQSWWRMWPQANVGIVTGERSNLAVLDVDDAHGGRETLMALIAEHGIDVATVTAITGSGGLHLYYRLPAEGIRNSAGALGPGLDVRGNGGYVVAPPSLHASGGVYAWGQDNPRSADLLPFPAKLLPLLRPRRLADEPMSEAEPIREGRRDDLLASFAGRLRNMGEDAAAIEDHLAIFNRRCSPPKSADELHRIACSIGRYPINKRPLASGRPVWESFPPEARQWA